MKNTSVDQLVGKLLRLHEKTLPRPFPYADCRKIKGNEDELYGDLIPDLNTYFYGIASPSGAVNKLLQRPKDHLLESQSWLSKSFFERWPQYKPLEPLITESNTPDLYAELMLHEKIRTTLLKLLSQLLTEQNAARQRDA
jgi:hypothetical protein